MSFKRREGQGLRVRTPVFGASQAKENVPGWLVELHLQPLPETQPRFVALGSNQNATILLSGEDHRFVSQDQQIVGRGGDRLGAGRGEMRVMGGERENRSIKRQRAWLTLPGSFWLQAGLWRCRLPQLQLIQVLLLEMLLFGLAFKRIKEKETIKKGPLKRWALENRPVK